MIFFCCMTKILFQLQTGNMVWYTLSGLNIPLAYKIQTTYIRPYYLSGAEIIYNVIVPSWIFEAWNPYKEKVIYLHVVRTDIEISGYFSLLHEDYIHRECSVIYHTFGTGIDCSILTSNCATSSRIWTKLLVCFNDITCSWVRWWDQNLEHNQFFIVWTLFPRITLLFC